MADAVKDVRFHLLGPFQVLVGQNEITITGRERTLLATLLCHANTPVEVDRLVDAIWGERPPRDARNQLQSVVSRLRRRLVAAGVSETIVMTAPAGYRIKVAPDQLDLTQFKIALADARSAATSDQAGAAVTGYRNALELWRGPALAGVESDLLRRLAASLDEEHLQAIEERLELELALGGAGELVAELTDLVVEHRYREKLHAALMLALYRAGRQADALAAYQRARRILVDEVGTEPGPVLHELHQRILRDDPTLVASSPTGNVGPTARHCLPRMVTDFTGRTEALAQFFEEARAQRGATTVIAIDGMAGVGKTTLAVHVGHQLADRYPDAQLFINLHGHSERGPLDPSEALGMLLRQLGVPSGRIPIDLEDRVATWRHECANRRMLVILDNAASTDQVAPLLLSSPQSLVLVTSRRRLLGLEASRPLSLGVLTPDEAMMLLHQIVGDRVLHEPEAAAELARRCGYLPLALRLAGARLVHRPSWRIADLLDRLADARVLLAQSTGDERTVSDAFALSYQQLTPDMQRAFRLLGLHPGEEFDAWVAAAMADRSLSEAQESLEHLHDRHLVEEARPGRYCFHDLVKEYASQLAMRTDSADDRATAVQRMLDYYLHRTFLANNAIEQSNHAGIFELSSPIRPDLLSLSAEHALPWLEAERLTLVAVIRYAAASGYDLQAWQLARASWAYLYRRGYVDDLLETHSVGLAAAERLGDENAIAIMCNYLASAYEKLGELEHAGRLLTRAIALWSGLGKATGVATARTNLALVYRRLGRLTESIEHHERALAYRQRSGDLRRMGMILQNLGQSYTDLGRYHEAIRCHRRRLAISRELGDLVGCANPLGSLGAIRTQLGQYSRARRLLMASLRLKRRVGRREGESVVVNDLGVLHRHLRQYTEAVNYHREAVTIARDAGDRAAVCAARNDLGSTLRVAGDPQTAIAEHQAVLAEATKMKLKFEQARALDGIAACLRDTDPAEARRHWRRALVLYREMGVEPKQAELEQRLRELDGVAEGPPPPHQPESALAG